MPPHPMNPIFIGLTLPPPVFSGCRAFDWHTCTSRSASSVPKPAWPLFGAVLRRSTSDKVPQPWPQDRSDQQAPRHHQPILEELQSERLLPVFRRRLLPQSECQTLRIQMERKGTRRGCKALVVACCPPNPEM